MVVKGPPHAYDDTLRGLLGRRMIDQIVWGMIRSTSDELDRDTLIKAITHTGQRQSVRLTDSKKVHRFGPSFWSTRRNHLHRSNQVNCDDDDAITDDKDSKIGDSLDEDIEHGFAFEKAENTTGTSITPVLGISTSNNALFPFQIIAFRWMGDLWLRERRRYWRR